MKRTIRKTVLLFAAALLSVCFLPTAVFADTPYTDDAGNYVEWWNFRNTETNNAVTERPTPTNDKEAWGKWAAQYGTGWSAAPTPPIIVNNKLYIGVGKQIVEVNKETGEALRYSEEMPANVGYAMQSPVYADGKIFVAITNGRICAINISDMKLAWTTDNSDIIKGQTVSPISYKKINGTGYIYTGTWTKDGGDLICATTDNNDLMIDEKGATIKKLKWHFNPQIEDAQNLEENDCVALGYYWTGAYVSDRYLAIGADNGSTLGDYVNDTAFYTLDPMTGEIIDVIYGIKGQVRSTAVYADGYLYFSTKGAKVYKVSVDQDGNMGTPSYIDLGEFGASAATATPVVYGGKIYLGVQGKGGAFSADGGHGFLVVKNDPSLSQSSFVYNIPVPGYPQAGALLSDYHVDEDFNGDKKADGRVYLFFTYNAPPGGLFYTYDTPEQTKPTSLSVEESKIFVPGKEKQQYCISSIVVDQSGVLYYKNDSGYVFAVESNPAALLNLEVQDEQGNICAMDQPFYAKTAEYTCVVPTSAEKARFVLTLEEGVSATVNGTAYSAAGAVVPLPEEETAVQIVTNKNGKSRTYSVTVRKQSADATLSALGSAMTNTAPNLSTAVVREMTPGFSQETEDYEFDWITTGNGDSKDPATKDMMNIFLKTSSEKATVQVFPGENVDTASNRMNADGITIKEYAVSNNTMYRQRFPVYCLSKKHDSTARIVVTAEDGETTKEYRVKFNRRVYVSEVTLDQEEAELNEGETLLLNAEVLPENATDPSLTWTSSNESVAKVDEQGLVTALEDGTAVITAASEDGPSASCTVTVHTVPVEDAVLVTAPAGSVITAGKQNGNFSYTWFEPEETTELESGSVRSRFAAVEGNTFLRVQNPEGVTCWTFTPFESGTIKSVSREDLHIGDENFSADTVYKEFQYNRLDLGDIYLNINEQGYLPLDPGESRELDAFRNWNAIDGAANPNTALPDMHYEVTDIEGNPSTLVTASPDPNNSGLVTLKAASDKTGMAVVKVTYDAMTFKEAMASGFGAGGEDPTRFSAIWPECTGVFVVTVGCDGTSVPLGMTINENTHAAKEAGAKIDAEHDLLYYAGDEGAAYSFKPEAGATVSIARSTVTKQGLSFHGFSANGITAGEDGSVTIEGLTGGRHIVKVEKDGIANYQILSARKIGLKLQDAEGNAFEDGYRFRPGETVTAVLTSVNSPQESFSGCYHNGLSVVYEAENDSEVKVGETASESRDFSAREHSFTFTVPENWTKNTFTLRNGAILLSGSSDGPSGWHRGASYQSGIGDAVETAGTGVLGKLPDITLIIHSHTLEKTEAKEPECTEDGNIAYWKCAECETCFLDEDAKQEVAEEETILKATGHAWGDASYEWDDSLRFVTATHICTHDNSHTEEEKAETSVEITKPATATEMGETTYTAVFQNPAFQAQKKTVADVAMLIDISSAKIAVQNLVYSGSVKIPKVNVTWNGTAIVSGKDYRVSCKDKNAGTATVVITGIGRFGGTSKQTFSIQKAANTLRVKGTVSLSVKAGKKKSFSGKKVLTVKNAAGPVTYAKLKGDKRITINKKSGTITVKKGLKKGKTYKVVFRVNAVGNKNYLKGSRKVTVKIKVK